MRPSAGTSYGAPTEGEVELAAEVCERFASVEMVRMVNSGTEASMSAIRLARAATGRDKVVKFAGAYHGHVDGLLAEAGSGLATQGIPASPGVTEAQAADTDRRPLERPRRRWPRRSRRTSVAAIICEPIAGEHGRGPAGRRLPGAPARAGRRKRRPADLRRGDHGLSGCPRRRPGALRDHARPDPAGKGAGRRPAGRRLRRAPRADGASGAGRRRLPGRDAVRQPAGGGRGPRHPASASTPTPIDASAISPTGWRPACAPRPATAPCRWPRRPAW